MDKSSIIGIVLIVGILIGFQYLNQPSDAEIAQLKREQFLRDSIASAKLTKQVPSIEEELALVPDSILEGVDSTQKVETAKAFIKEQKAALKNEKLDIFAAASTGKLEEYTLENDKLILTISSKGGYITSARLKEYQTYANYSIAREQAKGGEVKILEPLQLFDKDSSIQYLKFYIDKSKEIKTSNLYFTKVSLTDNKLVLRSNSVDPTKYIEYVYVIGENSYDVSYNINLVGLDTKVDGKDIHLNWAVKSLATEKLTEGKSENQSRMSSVFYKEQNLDREYLSELKTDSKIIPNKLDWVAFKHCYFSSIILSEEGFSKGSFVGSSPIKNSRYSDRYIANLDVSRTMNSTTTIPLQFYFGPNDYEELAAYKNDTEDLIDFGITPLRQINKYLIMPVFNFFDNFGWSIGIVILIVTIMVRIIILPLTYKSYLSSAKMKVLKPEIEEINEKFKDGKDPLKKQQETMALYRKTGVSPMAGCLPALIQMPLVIAVFRFFPSTIGLRQKAFLWAEDLSTYESVLQLPVSIPAYGSHVSLFTIILCISMIFYTKVNSSQMTMPTQPGAPNMKVIMYLMPVMMLFFFNSYASGLSFYYICGNLLTMGLMLMIKAYLIDENKIRLAIEENKKKPKKKSAFTQRMEDLMKQQQAKQATKKK